MQTHPTTENKQARTTIKQSSQHSGKLQTTRNMEQISNAADILHGLENMIC